MENNKYYVPDIEDIHIGYECELKLKENSKTKWCKIIIEDGQDIEEIVRSYCYGIPNDIRVPYLTKEQIEAEGWETEFNTSFDSVLFYAQRGNLFKLIYNYDIKILDIWTNDSEDDRTVGLFRGECKSINEFRYICKLLNIK